MGSSGRQLQGWVGCSCGEGGKQDSQEFLAAAPSLRVKLTGPCSMARALLVLPHGDGNSRYQKEQLVASIGLQMLQRLVVSLSAPGIQRLLRFVIATSRAEKDGE